MISEPLIITAHLEGVEIAGNGNDECTTGDVNDEEWEWNRKPPATEWDAGDLATSVS